MGNETEKQKLNNIAQEYYKRDFDDLCDRRKRAVRHALEIKEGRL